MSYLSISNLLILFVTKMRFVHQLHHLFIEKSCALQNYCFLLTTDENDVRKANYLQK